MGSDNETRVALRGARVWGYVSDSKQLELDAKLDRVIALLWGLTRKRA
ncbi:MAG: hypothetical protein AAF654_00265 [Myxococcota bacterium]